MKSLPEILSDLYQVHNDLVTYAVGNEFNPLYCEYINVFRMFSESEKALTLIINKGVLSCT